jgi:REP element-mobilizing transposase RayT
MDQIQAEEGFQLLAYVIMPDHLHLVVSLPAHLTTTRVMKMIKGRFARLYNERAGARGPFWQDRFHEEALQSEEQLWTAIQYVVYNPVKAGVVQRPEDYRWSSAGHPSPPVRLET